MFNKDLTPIYDGRVLVNETALNNPVVKAALHDMSKRNFEPQRINKYGVWYISDRHLAIQLPMCQLNYWHIGSFILSNHLL